MEKICVLSEIDEYTDILWHLRTKINTTAVIYLKALEDESLSMIVAAEVARKYVHARKWAPGQKNYDKVLHR